ncbi:MAG: hypothetical protein ACI82Z_001075, partial [Cellvibrionaceae bacterium]
MKIYFLSQALLLSGTADAQTHITHHTSHITHHTSHIIE